MPECTLHLKGGSLLEFSNCYILVLSCELHMYYGMWQGGFLSQHIDITGSGNIVYLAQYHCVVLATCQSVNDTVKECE